MNYEETEEFSRDFKKLRRKFRSLEGDLQVAKRNAIELFHEHNIDNRSILEIAGVGNSEKLKFYKVNKFACSDLKGKGNNSGIRLVYAYISETITVILLEIYFKGDRENENRQRIKNFLSVHGPA